VSSTTGSAGDQPPGEATFGDTPAQGVGEIAHDLNNALTSVLGYAEIIAEDARSGNVSARDAEQLLAATREAVALVKVLRASGRVALPAHDPATGPPDQPEGV
jgi:signal transduction histidine kinase